MKASQNNHRFLVLGAVAIDLTDSEILSRLILEARKPELPYGEVKWTKVSRTKLEAYVGRDPSPSTRRETIVTWVLIGILLMVLIVWLLWVFGIEW